VEFSSVTLSHKNLQSQYKELFIEAWLLVVVSVHRFQTKTHKSFKQSPREVSSRLVHLFNRYIGEDSNHNSLKSKIESCIFQDVEGRRFNETNGKTKLFPILMCTAKFLSNLYENPSLRPIKVIKSSRTGIYICKTFKTFSGVYRSIRLDKCSNIMKVCRVAS
jgi:hypothetical protein